jgi:tetratricopeptide (TPR) repeat protein
MPNDVPCILGLIYVRKSSFRAYLLALSLSITFLVKADGHTSFYPLRISSAGHQSADTRPLELGVPIDRALMSGESHSYQIALNADQYLQIEVAQHGVNVIVAGFDPAGKKLTEVDSARGTQGSELLTFIADVSGNYRIHISAAERNVAPGRYEIKVIALRGPTVAERSLEEARRLSEESRNLRQNGKYGEALLLAERSLAIREKTLGPDHREVADSLHALASLYDDKSDYAKAEPLNLRALAIREKMLGPDHPDVAKTLNNLAWIYGVREDYAKAESFYGRALAIQENALGKKHPEVASTLNDLALLYYEKGDYDQSILTNQRVLAIREEMLGPDDSGVAKALNNLALVYAKKGDYSVRKCNLWKY